MTGSEITLALFTLCNGLRIIAYLPQIVRAARDNSGAEAISFSTWSQFLLANASAVAYAVVNKDDWAMAILFLGNGLGCAAILLIGIWKRRRHRRRISRSAAVVTTTSPPPRNGMPMTPGDSASSARGITISGQEHDIQWT